MGIPCTGGVGALRPPVRFDPPPGASTPLGPKGGVVAGSTFWHGCVRASTFPAGRACASTPFGCQVAFLWLRCGVCAPPQSPAGVARAIDLDDDDSHISVDTLDLVSCLRLPPRAEYRASLN